MVIVGSSRTNGSALARAAANAGSSTATGAPMTAREQDRLGADEVAGVLGEVGLDRGHDRRRTPRRRRG